MRTNSVELDAKVAAYDYEIVARWVIQNDGDPNHYSEQYQQTRGQLQPPLSLPPHAVQLPSVVAVVDARVGKLEWTFGNHLRRGWAIASDAHTNSRARTYTNTDGVRRSKRLKSFWFVSLPLRAL